MAKCQFGAELVMLARKLIYATLHKLKFLPENYIMQYVIYKTQCIMYITQCIIYKTHCVMKFSVRYL